jgi:hypothetical protein
MPRTCRSVASAVLLTALALLACGKKEPPPPSREQVTALLRQEAQSMKAEGEKLDPSLGVKTRWEIAAVDVRENAADKERPYTGRVRFKITTTTQDAATGPVTDEKEKVFRYAFSTARNRWEMQP